MTVAEGGEKKNHTHTNSSPVNLCFLSSMWVIWDQFPMGKTDRYSYTYNEELEVPAVIMGL